MKQIVLAGAFASILLASPPAAAQEAPNDAVHLLNRIAFGPRPGDVDRVLELGIDSFISEQLSPPDTDGELAAALSRFDLPSVPPAELAAADRAERQRRRMNRLMSADSTAMARPTGAPLRRRLIQQTQQSAIVRATVSRWQLREVMVDFWFNHFNVFMGKGPVPFVLNSYLDDVIRPHALGNFRELLTAVAQSPAMLIYLDNAQSVAPGSEPPRIAAAERRINRTMDPDRARQMRERLRRARRNLPTGLNENYARELLELHTLGVDGGYDQEDIVEVARVFTGWSVAQPRDYTFQFNEWAHDPGPKEVMGITIASGGVDEGLGLLDMLARHPATMHHLGQKLCARLVADEPPAGCVDAAVRAWHDSEGHIGEVLRAILASPEFWDSSNRGTKFKTPLEFLTSAIRALDAVPDTTYRLNGILNRLGQPLYLNPVPTGYPESSEDWINSGAVLNRFNVGMMLASGRGPIDADIVTLVGEHDDTVALIQRVNELVLGNGAGTNTLAVLHDELRGLDRDAARTLALALALGSPEFQRQ